MYSFNKKRITIISPNDGSDVRVGKVCRSLSKMNFDVHFIGWDRRPDIQKTLDLGATQIHLIKAPTPYGRFTFKDNLFFCKHIFTCLKQLRSNIVCCVNEEYSLVALPMRRVFYRYLVCDIFDGLYERHSFRSLLVRKFLKFAGFIGRYGADRLIVTDSARFKNIGCFKQKCIIIENYPEDPGEALANQPLDGPIHIYASGSLSIHRGLKQLIAAVNSTTDVEIISAGWLYDDYAKNVFAKHPKVSFHGIVTAHESLQLAAQSDAIFAFYEPLSINNKMASPNKIYDAMSVGRPVIINNEAGISQWVVDNNVGFRTSYFDEEGLKATFESLKQRRKSLPDFIKRQRLLFSQGYNWENMEKRLYDLYNSFM